MSSHHISVRRTRFVSWSRATLFRFTAVSYGNYLRQEPVGERFWSGGFSQNLVTRHSGVEASARIWLFHRLKPRLQGSKTLHLVYSDRLLESPALAFGLWSAFADRGASAQADARHSVPREADFQSAHGGGRPGR